MDFNLTEQQKLMQKLFREVAENEVKENAADVDENERFPKEAVQVMRDAKCWAFLIRRNTEEPVPTTSAISLQ